jgi:hypothetical protein
MDKAPQRCAAVDSPSRRATPQNTPLYMVIQMLVPHIILDVMRSSLLHPQVRGSDNRRDVCFPPRSPLPTPPPAAARDHHPEHDRIRGWLPVHGVLPRHPQRAARAHGRALHAPVPGRSDPGRHPRLRDEGDARAVPRGAAGARDRCLLPLRPHEVAGLPRRMPGGGLRAAAQPAAGPTRPVSDPGAGARESELLQRAPHRVPGLCPAAVPVLRLHRGALPCVEPQAAVGARARAGCVQQQ